MHFPTRMFGLSVASKRSQPIVAYAQVMYRPTLSPPPVPSTVFLPPPVPPPLPLLPTPIPPQTIPITLLIQSAPSARSPPPEPESAVREFCTSPTQVRIEQDELEEIPIKPSYRRRLWQIALGINLLLLLAAAIAIPFIVMSAWPSTTTTSSVNLPSQCLSYTTDTDDTRYYTYTGSTTLCDKPTPFGSASAWVRFSGTGTMLATSVIPPNQCGTSSTGYYTGSLPTVGITVTGTVCYNSPSNTCLDSNTISVTNCSGFYIYLLTATPNCYERYCTV